MARCPQPRRRDSPRAPARCPASRIAGASSAASADASWWNAKRRAPAFAYHSHVSSGFVIIRWTSCGSDDTFAIAAIAIGSDVRFGTYCPSITSTCQDVPRRLDRAQRLAQTREVGRDDRRSEVAISGRCTVHRARAYRLAVGGRYPRTNSVAGIRRLPSGCTSSNRNRPPAVWTAPSTNVPGSPIPLADRRAPDLEALAAERDERAGGRVERMDRALELCGRRVRVELRFRRLDLGGDRRAVVVLRLRRAPFPASSSSQRADEQRRTHRRRADRATCPEVSSGRDRRSPPSRRIGPVSRPSSISIVVTPVLVTGEHRALDRSRAAPPRQQREVDVHAAEARDVEDVRRQQRAVRDDGDRIRCELRKRVDVVAEPSSAARTSIPSPSAASFTGDASTLRPRPRGLSGRVYTAATSNASASGTSDGTAASGVPMKTTRTSSLFRAPAATATTSGLPLASSLPGAPASLPCGARGRCGR